MCFVPDQLRLTGPVRLFIWQSKASSSWVSPLLTDVVAHMPTSLDPEVSAAGFHSELIAIKPAQPV